MSNLLLFLIERPKRPRLSTGQLDKLADIFVDLGIVVVGSVILPVLFPGVDRQSLPFVLWGIVGALSFWTISVSLMKGVAV